MSAEPSGPPNDTSPDRFRSGDVRLGHILGVFGLKGELKVFLYNPASELFDDPRPVVLVAPNGQRKKGRLMTRRGTGKRIIGFLDGISTIEAAEALLDWEIVLEEQSLPQPEPGSWYLRDLIGLPVFLASGPRLGEIVEVHTAASMDVWVVRSGPKEWWILARKEDLLEVTPGKRVVVADEAPQAV